MASKKELKKQIKRQKALFAALYQVLGAHWASEKVLDVVSDASVGWYKGDGSELLPYMPPSEDTLRSVHRAVCPPQSMVE